MPSPNSIIDGAWLVFVLVWFVSALGAKKSVGRSWSWVGAVIRILFAVFVLRLVRLGAFERVVASSNALQTHAAIPICGAILCVAGIAFAIWARMHIGRNWGMPMSRREEPELVMSGPYRMVRHPIYTGILLAMLGSALASGLWWIAIFAPSVIYFVYSARTEERLMLQQFPNQYPDYMRRTQMLIPWVV